MTCDVILQKLEGYCWDVRLEVVRQFKSNKSCSTQIMFDGKLTIVKHKINRTKSER
jgi:hypothetical protein